MPTLPRMVQNELVGGRADYAPILRGDDMDWLMLCLQGITFTDAGERERVARILDSMHRTHPIGGGPDDVVRFAGHQAVPEPNPIGTRAEQAVQLQAYARALGARLRAVEGVTAFPAPEPAPVPWPPIPERVLPDHTAVILRATDTGIVQEVIADDYAALMQAVVEVADDPFGVVREAGARFFTEQPNLGVQHIPDLVIPAENQITEVPLVLARETAIWLVRFLHQGDMVRGIDAHHRFQLIRAMERGVATAGFPYQSVAKMEKIACACGCGQTIMVSGQDVMFLQDESGEDRETFFLPGRYRLCESDVWQEEWDAANADEPDEPDEDEIPY